MEEQANTLAPAMPAKSNRGWFQKGDGRINREGRPRGSITGATETTAATAPRTDRLMLLVTTAPDLAWRLRRHKSPVIENLPEDVEIVGMRLDAGTGYVALVIRSQSFRRVRRGTLLPAFEPKFHGLDYRRR